MNEQMPIAVLSRVSRSTRQKNPTWSILLANEYLEENNHLRKVLIHKAKSHCNESMLNKEEKLAFDAACSGARLMDLPLNLQSAVKNQSKSILFHTQKRPIPYPKRRVSGLRSIGLELRGVANAGRV